MENTKELAKYLAAEISNCNMLDMAALEAKINAALIVMSPPTSNKGKEVYNLQNKLAVTNSDKKAKNVMYNLQIKFWKDKTKKFISEQELQDCYIEMDKILEENGYENKG